VEIPFWRPIRKISIFREGGRDEGRIEAVGEVGCLRILEIFLSGDGEMEGEKYCHEDTQKFVDGARTDLRVDVRGGGFERF